MEATTLARMSYNPTVPVRGSEPKDVRTAIMRELRQRETDRLPAPSWPELAAALGANQTNVRHHAKVLRSLCLVDWTAEYRSLHLTPAGRLAADCLLTSGS